MIMFLDNTTHTADIFSLFAICLYIDDQINIYPKINENIENVYATFCVRKENMLNNMKMKSMDMKFNENVLKPYKTVLSTVAFHVFDMK